MRHTVHIGREDKVQGICCQSTAWVTIGNLTLFFDDYDLGNPAARIAKAREIIKALDAMATEIEAKVALGVEEPPK